MLTLVHSCWKVRVGRVDNIKVTVATELQKGITLAYDFVMWSELCRPLGLGTGLQCVWTFVMFITYGPCLWCGESPRHKQPRQTGACPVRFWTCLYLLSLRWTCVKLHKGSNRICITMTLNFVLIFRPGCLHMLAFLLKGFKALKFCFDNYPTQNF